MTPLPVGRGTTTAIQGLSSYSSSQHWTPNRVRIQEGTWVKWVATSGTHTVVAYGGNWTYQRDLAQGASVTRRFPHAGTYRFRCSLHSSVVNGTCEGMCGRIVVR